jgi:hypothetical protein
MKTLNYAFRFLDIFKQGRGGGVVADELQGFFQWRR